MNEKTRLAVAGLFRHARGVLEHQSAVFVCNALRMAYRRFNHPMWVIDEAERFIDSRIPGCMTVRRWLALNHPELKPQLNNKNMLIYRLAWIDNIVNELDPKGKTAPNSN